MDKYVDLFANYLQEKCKYPESAIIKTTYRYDGKEYDRVEVLDNELIIQAFVLMSEKHCSDLVKFPFYRTYSQRNTYGYLVLPACNVAVYDESNDIWHIYSANNLRVELSNPSFLNYEKAKERFEKRFNYLGNYELWKIIKRLSIALLCIVVLYAIAHIMSINGLLGGLIIPLDATAISFFVILVCLLLLPPLIPYIRSLTVGSVGLELRDPKDSIRRK